MWRLGVPTYVCLKCRLKGSHGRWGAEMLVDQINTLVERTRRDLCEKVCYYEAQDAVHDFILFPFCEPERTLALDAKN